MIPPSYQEIKADKLPRIEKDGTTVILIAGEALGVIKLLSYL
jgi:redox-sensitive bicupin YhaK (pirin superfamily)